LPNTTVALEEIEEITIYANREGGSLNTFHNQMNKPIREPQKVQEITKKRPLYCIKCFLEVDLDGAAG
jgi:hypothetical protein